MSLGYIYPALWFSDGAYLDVQGHQPSPTGFIMVSHSTFNPCTFISMAFGRIIKVAAGT